ncbi:zinc finger protein 511 [Talpa occidentalis]|uniref:zinc finger protein 511 n=1 Tax=Talpa occidentalis TaxID=50954 RepID=UPI00188F285B|nr:zinc finger protein 511 [Talpa occidentalis]
MQLPPALRARLAGAPGAAEPLPVERVPAAGAAPFGFAARLVRFPREHAFFEDGDVQRHLYLQDMLTQVAGAPERPRVPAFTCQVAGCCQVFDALQDYEHHYHSLHGSVCSFCKRAFPSGHLLDTHLLEWHDSLFQVLSERQAMYQCLVEGCTEKFKSSRDRKEHLVSQHLYPTDFRFDKPRKNKGPVSAPCQQKPRRGWGAPGRRRHGGLLGASGSPPRACGPQDPRRHLLWPGGLEGLQKQQDEKPTAVTPREAAAGGVFAALTRRRGQGPVGRAAPAHVQHRVSRAQETSAGERLKPAQSLRDARGRPQRGTGSDPTDRLPATPGCGSRVGSFPRPRPQAWVWHRPAAISGDGLPGAGVARGLGGASASRGPVPAAGAAPPARAAFGPREGRPAGPPRPAREGGRWRRCWGPPPEGARGPRPLPARTGRRRTSCPERRAGRRFALKPAAACGAAGGRVQPLRGRARLRVPGRPVSPSRRGTADAAGSR